MCEDIQIMKMESKTFFDPLTKIWHASESQQIFNPNIGLGSLILRVLATTPERVTQISADNGAKMTCHEMRMRTLKIASHLVNCGFKQNDIVGVIASNSENLAPTVFACLTLGLPINTLAPIMIESDIVQMYSKTKPKAIFCDANIVQVVQKAVEKMKLNTKIFTLMEKVENYEFIDDLIVGYLDTDKFIFPAVVDISSAIALILCSSGSTGSPKAVCKSHEQLISNLTDRCLSRTESQDISFNFSTVYWISGVCWLITGTLYGSKRVITTKTFSPRMFLKIVNEYQVKTAFIPPSGLAELIAIAEIQVQSPMKSLKTMMTAGSHVSKYNADKVRQIWPHVNFFVSYGTTEADLVADTSLKYRESSVGLIHSGSQVIIIDDSNEHRLGPNEVGEICYKCKIPFVGYYDDPEMTQEAISNGDFFKTGDLGYFDDDGFLFISGRKKEMLKYNNYQVCPSELEELIDSIDGVQSSCVVGVLDEKTGNDRIFAFVENFQEKLSKDQILNFVNSKVIDAKKLRGGVHSVDSLPRTISGKIKKTEVKKIAESIKFH